MSKPAPTTETPTSTERRCFHCHTTHDNNWFTYEGDGGAPVLVCLACAVHGDEIHYGELDPSLKMLELHYAGKLPSIHTLLV